jgi:hypothetical protein
VPHSNNEKLLTHYKSGMNMGSTSPIKMRYMRTGKRLTDRSAAELLLLDLISKHGEDRVKNQLNANAKKYAIN